ncbi:MBL fold metallo-hydrolase [Evansella clarkii]|uniref:MBL fold metallo-hydrolase n=1 Tax=Evansella clarkii TaxID=79879 RepID=UPI000B44ABBC|nr:MBL fold metallo-hydrolase [Evansella clarkii]
MKWKQIPLGPLQTNSFVIYDGTEWIIVDPGGDGEKLLGWLKDENISVKAILLTHAHFDHIGAVDIVRDTFKAPVYIHEKEAEWLTDPQLNGSGLFPGIEPVKAGPADHILSSKEKDISLIGIYLQILETPGHSPGSVSYYWKEKGIIFSGDVLFHGGVGRTDLPGGDHETLMDTIHEKMLSLPDETIVANGHGPVTKIGKEKEINPFINGFGW